MTDDGEELWRLFVAVPIGDELRDALAAYVERLREHPEARSLRWSDPAGWHATLAFLGSLPRGSVPGLTRTLRTIAPAHAAFSARTGGVGAFPSPRDMRVLWYGIDDDAGRLSELAGDVCGALKLDAGRFRAHLTLARSRDARRGPVSLMTLAAGAGEPPRGVIEVDRIGLYRSHLGRGPARYEELGHAPLVAGRSEARQ